MNRLHCTAVYCTVLHCTHDADGPLPPLLHDLLAVLHGPGLGLLPAVQPQQVPEVADLAAPRLRRHHRLQRLQQPARAVPANIILEDDFFYFF